MSLEPNIPNAVISNTLPTSQYSEFQVSTAFATTTQSTPSSSISRWQQTVSAEWAPDDHGIFARCFHSCVDVYNLLLRKIQDDVVLSPHLYEPVRELFNRFIIWGETVNVRTGKLDMRLLQGSQVKKVTLETVIGIGNTLSQDLIHYVFHSPAARKEFLQSADITVLHDEAQYVIAERSDCHKCNAAVTIEDGLHGIKNILKALDQLTKCLMSISGINLSNKSQSPSITQSRSRSPMDFFSDRIHTKLPQANEKVVARLGKFYWDQFKRHQAAIDALTQESSPSELQTESISTRGTDTSKFHDSALGSSDATEMANTEIIATSFTGSSISKTLLPQFRKNYLCLFSGCCEEDTVLDSHQAWAEHFIIAHGAQIDSGISNCPLCHGNIGGFALFKHYVQHMNDLAPTILTDAAREGADDETRYHRSLLEPEHDGIVDVEHSRGPLLLGADEQRILNVPRTRISRTSLGGRSGSGGVNGMRLSPAGQLTALGEPPILPTNSSQARSVSMNLSRVIAGSTSKISSRCHISRFEAAPRPSSSPKKQSGQHKCNYRGCKLPKDFSGFKSAHDLKRHKRTVHGEACEESYMCTVTGCKKPNKPWPRCDNFKAHVKRMHPREDVDEIIQRSRHSYVTTGDEPADELSYQDDLLAAPNSLVHDQMQTTPFLNHSSQSFDLATSKERGVPELSNPDVFLWTQHHISPLRQAANVQDYDEPFSELDILDFHSNNADSINNDL